MAYDYMDKLDEERAPKRYAVECDANGDTDVIFETNEEWEAVQFCDEEACKLQAEVNKTGDIYIYQVIDRDAFGKDSVVSTVWVRPERKKHVNERAVFDRLFPGHKKERA